MAFIVLYDANVLCPNTLRDLLIRIAQPWYTFPVPAVRVSGSFVRRYM